MYIHNIHNIHSINRIKNIGIARNNKLADISSAFLQYYKKTLTYNLTDVEKDFLEKKYNLYFTIVIAISKIAHLTSIDSSTNYTITNTTNNSIDKESELISIISNAMQNLQYLRNNAESIPIKFIDLHGTINTNKYFIIPENVTICLLTPINKILSRSLLQIQNILKKFANLNFKKKFLQNPYCVGNDTDFFEDAIIMHSGQPCINLKIAYKNVDDHVLGLIHIETGKKYKIHDLSHINNDELKKMRLLDPENPTVQSILLQDYIVKNNFSYYSIKNIA